MLVDLIKNQVDLKIITFFKDESLRSFFINHPAKQKCIDKCLLEINKVLGLKPSLINEKIIFDIADSIALIFCKQALFEKEKEIATQAQLLKQKEETEKTRYIHKMMQETHAGVDERINDKEM